MSNKSKAFNRNKWTVVMATAAILLVCTAGVTAVRAYLTAQSGEKQNEFAPMTYPDTEIVEPNTEFTLADGEKTISKHAKVSNPAGLQKKPVFVRVAVVCSVYDSTGINVSYEYNCTASFTPEAEWTKVGDYYYYNSIVAPGNETSDIFGDNENNVTINGADALPVGYRVELAVIADTVQAVSTDSAKWTADDYTTDEVAKAWSGITPTLSESSVKWSAS